MESGVNASGPSSAEAEAGDPPEQMEGPIVGDVYSVASRAYSVIQQRESHPVVVLSPIAGTDEWNVWPRTSQKSRPGIDHDPNLSLGLERAGRFCGRDITRLPGHVFSDPKLSKHRGTLDPATFTKLMDWWLA
ncbi:hypothetical protein acdb102_21580 [Acidothermaceae bacterium B102]|nr:hypothetical protein acdb102_21580 [Acidothermaceae bacterium B102]